MQRYSISFSFASMRVTLWSMREAKQHVQEEEYTFPYHWVIQPDTRKGAVYFGYWSMALECAGDLSGKDVLDAGCGDGYFTSLVLKKDPHSVVGVDYSHRAISFARLLVPHATFFVEDLATLSFEKDSFDIIFLIEVLEHISREKRAEIAKELARVLRPGGMVIASSPSLCMPVIEKHEEHFSRETFRSALGPHFMLERVKSQDRGGMIHTVFWLLFRLWKNRFWTLHPLVFFWTTVLYTRCMTRASLDSARRFVGAFRKV